MKNALIIIDFVNDFVAENGKLTCGKPAQEIDMIIARKIEEFRRNDDFIVNASDLHDENDEYNPERKLFPPHCCASTSGVDLYGLTKKAVEQTDASNLISIHKTRYSAFAGTCLDMKLRERSVKNIYLVGVCTDICVLHTAIDAYNLGYQLYVIKDATASFNSAGHTFALEHFKNSLGATII